jgi:PAS domain S-box-containing protein
MEIERRGMVDRPATTPNEGESSSSSAHTVDEFTSQYADFTAIVAQLREAYNDLTGRYASLQDELAVTNEKLRASFDERERSAVYLERILHSVPSGVVAVDLDGRVQLYNRAAEELFGKASSDVVGHDYGRVLPGQTPSAASALKGPRAVTDGEKKIARQNGETVPVAVSTSLLTDPEGRVHGAVEIVNDLSRLRWLEGEVSRVQMLAALGEMAATVAHEIRNPLGGIAGFAGLLAREFDAGDDRRRMADNIIKGCENLNRIVTNLLRYAQPLRLEQRPCDLRVELEEEMALVQQDLSGRKRPVQLNRSMGSEPVTVNVDPTQIRMAVHNLLLNAADASGEGTIHCGMIPEADGDQGGRLRIWVTDDGPGIPGAHADKIFNPFFTTKDKGTGLGLATVRKIIEAHGGTVSCTNPPSGGAQFDLYLPIG